MLVIVTKSNRAGKKWRATFVDEGKVIHFGQEGKEDYTIHKDVVRLARYIARHDNGREDWTRQGIMSPGFWSRWLLWNKPTLKASAKDIEKRFGIKIRLIQ
jgi:hypothetical protein